MTRLLGHLRVPFFVALAALFLTAPARAQGAMQVFGPTTAGHLSMYLGKGGEAIDAGGPSTTNGPPQNSTLPGTRPTGLGIVNSGLGNCQWSGYANAPYSELCGGFDGAGNALFTIDRIGGGATPSVTFRIGGVDFPFPGTITSPSFTTITFPNATNGEIVMPPAMTAPLHEFGNTNATCNQFIMANQNTNWCVDYAKLYDLGNELYTALDLTGAATAGQIVGADATVSGATFNVRYTIQSGDTLNNVAQGVFNCLLSSAAAHCAGTTAGLPAALAALKDANNVGYQLLIPGATFAGQNLVANGFVFDYPWCTTCSLTAVSSADATVRIYSAAGGVGVPPALDGNPNFILTRYTPGYTNRAFDLFGQLIWEGTPGTQLGAIYAQMDATPPKIDMLMTARGSSGNTTKRLGVADGVFLFNEGAACLGDLGVGQFSACGVSANAFYLGDDIATGGQTLLKDISGNTEVLSQAGKSLVLAANSGSASFAITPTTINTGYPIHFAPLGAAAAGPGAGGQTNQLVLTGGSAGVAFNATNNSAPTFSVDNSGNALLTNTLTLASSTTGAGTQTFTNSPCTGSLTTERWIGVAITGQSGAWYIPACQ